MHRPTTPARPATGETATASASSPPAWAPLASGYRSCARERTSRVPGGAVQVFLRLGHRVHYDGLVAYPRCLVSNLLSSRIVKVIVHAAQ